MGRVAFVLNMPTPYRNPVFRLLVGRGNHTYRFMYCASAEPDRSWKVTTEDMDSVFLGRNFLGFFSGYIHANFDVLKELAKFRPDVVVTGGYNPTHLLAVMYCLIMRARHVSGTDGDLEFEQRLTALHRIVRRIVRRFTAAYIGPSDSSLALFQSWGASRAQVFKAPLCADNVAMLRTQEEIKQYDFIFCGRLVDDKGPLFALNVAARVAKMLRKRISIVFLGDGPLYREIQQRSRSISSVDVTLAGFVQPDDIPDWFGKSRVLLLPSNYDAWGLVVNEACAAGLPVLSSPFVGASRELVEEGLNGFTLPLDLECWAARASEIVSDQYRLRTMGQHGRIKVGDYSYATAAAGYEDAIEHALNRASR